jgi:hypothetical protein
MTQIGRTHKRHDLEQQVRRDPDGQSTQAGMTRRTHTGRHDLDSQDTQAGITLTRRNMGEQNL